MISSRKMFSRVPQRLLARDQEKTHGILAADTEG